MSSVSVEGSSQKELKTGSESSQEVPCCHAEIELKMSVTISRAWADAFKSPGSGDCEDFLKKIVSEATKKNHKVRIIDSEGTSILEGCFCGIKEIRTALQNAIRKQQTEENSGKPISSERVTALETSQQSHLENDKLGTKEVSHIKPSALFDNSTSGKVENEQSDVGNVSDDRSRNKEELKFQQQKESAKSNLKNGAEESNSENLNNAEEKNKRQRILIVKNQSVNMNQHEGKQVTKRGDSEGRDQLKKESTSKNDNYSKNVKQQVGSLIHPVLSTLTNDEHSDMQRDSIKTSHRVKTFENEHKVVTNSGNSEGRDDLKKEGTSKNVGCSANLKHQEKDPDMSTSKNTEHRENLKYTAKSTKSTNSPSLQEKKTSDPELDRICALILLPSIYIDEDIFYYLVRCRNYELSHISQKCDVFESYKIEQEHKLAFEAKPQYDTDSVIAEFRELYGQTTITRVNIPDGVDPESLKSLVEAMAEFKDVELRFISQERVFKIVGLYRETTRAKEMLIEIIASNTYQASEATTKRKVQLNVHITTTPKDSEQTRSVQSYSATASIAIHQQRRSSFRILSEEYNSLLLSASNTLTIQIKHDDLTTMHDVDVMVNCITHQLDVDGPLAVQLIEAAGTSVLTELVIHKSRLGFLHTGNLVHTNAGNLKGAKAIIHVVRPQVVEFPLNDQRSMDALKKAFVNCLSYTNDVLRLKSICLPPIGFMLYGAEMVVDCFLDAVEAFASTVVNGNPPAAAQHQHDHLNYIQLVTNEQYCIRQLIQRVKQRIGA